MMDWQTKDIKRALRLAKPFVHKGGVMPILNNVCFRNDCLFGFDNHIGCGIDFDAAGFEGLIPFDKLFVFIDKAPGETVQVTVDGTTVKLKSGKSRATLPCSPVDDYPDLTEFVDRMDFKPVTEDFFAGLKLCSEFTAKKTSRLEFTAVNFDGKYLSSTDCVRIARYKLDDFTDFPVALYPVELIKAVPACDTMAVLDDQVAFFKDNDLFFGSLIKAKFPNIENHFPKPEMYVDIPKDELIVGLVKVGDFSDASQTYGDCIIEFGDSITIRYKGETAQITEVFDFGNQLPKASYLVNPYRLSVILKHCEKFAFVQVGSIDIFYGEDGEKFQAVICIRKTL